MSGKPETYIGPYLVLEPIGAGGMGEVFRARDPKLGRLVALKILPASYASDPERLHRFEQEALTLAALAHPNIVQVFDAGQHDGRPYLIMELLTGETLRERLGRGRLSLRRALEVAIPMAQALAAAHDKGILHRDLKPENIFLTQDGQVKLLDFGLAKAGPQLSSGDDATVAISKVPQQTREGVLLGTVAYMSPEQVRGEALKAQSDLFAFGVVLFEMVTGLRPFVATSSIETLHAILNQDMPEPPAEARVPLPVQRILGRCLEKAAHQRFESARDLAFALENLAGGSTTSQPELTVAGLRTRSWLRRGWLVPAGVGACALAAGLTLGSLGGHRPALSYPLARDLELSNARLLPGGRGLILEGRLSRSDPRQCWTAAPGGQPVALAGTEGSVLLDVFPDGGVLLARDPIGQPGALAVLAPGGGRPMPLAPAVVWHFPWDGKGRPWRMRVGLDGPGTQVARLIEELQPPDRNQGDTENWKVRHSIPLGVAVAGPAPRGWFRLDAAGERIWWLEEDAGRAALVTLDRQGEVSRTVLEVPFLGLALASGPGGFQATYPRPEGPGTVLARIGRRGGLKTVAEFQEACRIVDVDSHGRPLLLPERRVDRVRWGTLGEPGEREATLGEGEVLRGLAPDGAALLIATPEGARIQRRGEAEPLRATRGRPLGLLGAPGMAVAVAGPQGPVLQVQPLDSSGEAGISLSGWQALAFARPVPGREQLLVGGLQTGDGSLGGRCTYLVSLKGGRVRRLPAETIPVAAPDGARALWLVQDGARFSWGPLDLSSGEKGAWPFTPEPGFRPLAWFSAQEVAGAVRTGQEAWEVRAMDLRTGAERSLGRVAVPDGGRDAGEAVLQLSADGRAWAVSWSERQPGRPFLVN